MTSRRAGRRAAVDIVYQADITHTPAPDVLAGWIAAGREVDPFTRALVEGVDHHGPSIDLLLETHAKGWTVARMAALDRSILRVAVEELRWHDEVPDPVAISEAVEAAAELSSEDAKGFVNGILGSIARESHAGDPAPGVTPG